MVLSMTGFATHTFELPIGSQTATATIHLKSLNARFFEASCKMPFVFSSLETAMLKRLRERLVRGTVYCTIFLNSPMPLGGKPRASLPVVEGYLDAAETIEKHFGERAHISQDLSMAHLLMLPNVIEFGENTLDPIVTKQLLEHIDVTIDLLIAERAREGAALAADLALRLNTIGETVSIVRRRAAVVTDLKKAKLVADMKQLIAHASIEEKDHYFQLIYSQLDKIDIHEEIVRLETHVANAQTIISTGPDEKGKRLDFTLQEMSREANTIGAKCADSELGALAITIKVELEKLREQVQNII